MAADASLRSKTTVFVVLLSFISGGQAAVSGTTCTAGGQECAAIANSFCDTVTNDYCICVDIATEGSSDDCGFTDCSSDDSVCGTADTNSECVSSTECACSQGYELTGADDQNECIAKVVGSSCSSDADCAQTSDTVCNTVSGTCACEAQFEATTAGACTAKTVGDSCTPGGGECNDIAEGECNTVLTNPVCSCGYGYTGSSGASSCTANVVGATCTSDGYQCTPITWGYCNIAVASPECGCAAITTASGTTCSVTACTADATCEALDSNSACTGGSSNECECVANYEIFADGTSNKCQPGVGATCSSAGGECMHLLGGYCDTTTTPSAPVCACGDIFDVSGGTSCYFKSCAADATCTALDANSECVKDMCMCKSGYSINTSKLCSMTGGSDGIKASIVAMLGCLVLSYLRM
ncbi:multiple epidermal growth factor-like domains protein 11 [Mya arenaria]|uniref:multiple epidermal growth factor-like domains protein 11 n=1 Tax=Mya arenaria TaxID=6604 RepID=UPI0022E5C054|nr:multiple epidermal growth factor-like domains protein 11 [Mya arenaria]